MVESESDINQALYFIYLQEVEAEQCVKAVKSVVCFLCIQFLSTFKQKIYILCKYTLANKVK